MESSRRCSFRCRIFSWNNICDCVSTLESTGIETTSTDGVSLSKPTLTKTVSRVYPRQNHLSKKMNLYQVVCHLFGEKHDVVVSFNERGNIRRGAQFAFEQCVLSRNGEPPYANLVFSLSWSTEGWCSSRFYDYDKGTLLSFFTRCSAFLEVYRDYTTNTGMGLGYKELIWSSFQNSAVKIQRCFRMWRNRERKWHALEAIAQWHGHPRRVILA